MKNGKFLFIAMIFIVSLVCLSAVSAAEDAASDVIADTNDDTILEESIDDANLGDSDNEDLEDSELGTPLMIGSFSTLNDDVNKDTDVVDFTYDYYWQNTDEDAPFQGGVTINHNVTINGNGYTIDADHQARIFKVPDDITVVFKDINFRNAYVAPKEEGGAIKGELLSNAQAINCTFANNEAFSGGALTEVDAINCTFVNNTAFSAGGAVYYGNTENCTFINNSAGAGGAVYGTDILSINCSFVNNTASTGGAINYGSAVDCTFTANTAGYKGGALNDVRASNCIFTQNSAAYGGAASDSDAVNCIFTQNSAQYGGALYGGQATNCTFKLNTATKNGTDAYEAITDDDCRFIKSTKITAKAVTAVYNNNKYLVITLKDSEGNALNGVYVTVTLSSAKKYKTDKNGQIKINVGKLVPKTYTAKISYAGTADYIKSSATAKVVVKKATPKMTAKAKTFKVKVKTKKYTITLKNNKGKVLKSTKVTLRVNKKTFSAKTNSKGVATFKITNLKKKGKFTATIKFAGSKYYNKLTKKVKITVKK